MQMVLLPVDVTPKPTACLEGGWQVAANVVRDTSADSSGDARFLWPCKTPHVQKRKVH